MPEISSPHATSHEDGGEDEVEFLKLKDRKHATKHEGGDDALTLTSIDSAVCRIKTGQYTGDGSTSHAITGVGFQPKFVKVWVHETGAGDWRRILEKTDTMASALCVLHHTGAEYHRVAQPDSIIALGADGFTVDDGGADNDPNKNDQVYDYLALG